VLSYYVAVAGVVVSNLFFNILNIVVNIVISLRTGTKESEGDKRHHQAQKRGKARARSNTSVQEQDKSR
jgi:hypothetical protein